MQRRRQLAGGLLVLVLLGWATPFVPSLLAGQHDEPWTLPGADLPSRHAVEFGTHGFTHEPMAGADPGARAAWLDDARSAHDLLVTRAHARFPMLSSLAYPHSSLDDALVSDALEAGFVVGVSGRAELGDPHTVQPSTMLQLERTSRLGTGQADAEVVAAALAEPGHVSLMFHHGRLNDADSLDPATVALLANQTTHWPTTLGELGWWVRALQSAMLQPTATSLWWTWPDAVADVEIPLTLDCPAQSPAPNWPTTSLDAGPALLQEGVRMDDGRAFVTLDRDQAITVDEAAACSLAPWFNGLAGPLTVHVDDVRIPLMVWEAWVDTGLADRQPLTLMLGPFTDLSSSHGPLLAIPCCRDPAALEAWLDHGVWSQWRGWPAHLYGPNWGWWLALLVAVPAAVLVWPSRPQTLDEVTTAPTTGTGDDEVTTAPASNSADEAHAIRVAADVDARD